MASRLGRRGRWRPTVRILEGGMVLPALPPRPWAGACASASGARLQRLRSTFVGTAPAPVPVACGGRSLAAQRSHEPPCAHAAALGSNVYRGTADVASAASHRSLPARDLFNRERAAVARLRDLLESLASPEAALAEQTLRQMGDVLFSVVVVGEFNAGKSTVVNALAGYSALEEGVLPTTAAVTELIHAKTPYEDSVGAIFRVGVPITAEWLHDVRLVDTPGTNSIIEHHELLTTRFLPFADLIIFVTSCDRPFSASERAFLEKIREWGKKVVVLANKSDLLATDEERTRICEFVEEHSRRLLSQRPPVFLLAALAARQAQVNGEPIERGFAKFEHFLRSFLLSQERQRWRLLAPLGVAKKLVETAETLVAEKSALLREDTEVLEQVTDGTEILCRELREGTDSLKDRLEAILRRLSDRTEDFVARRLRLSQVLSLLWPDDLRRDFERVVVGDVAAQIDAEVRGSAERLAQRADAHARSTLALVNQRLRCRHSLTGVRLGGQPEAVYLARDVHLQALSRSAALAAEELRADAASARLAEHVRTSLAATLAVEVSALGLGALVLISALDLKTLGAASGLALSGLGVLPLRNLLLSHDFRQRIDGVVEQLRAALEDQGTRASAVSSERLAEAVAPYRQAVAAEERALARLRGELAAVAAELREIRKGVPAAVEG